MLSRALLLLTSVLVLVATGPARAAIGGLPGNTSAGDVSPKWESLRPKLFGDRPIFSPPSQVHLTVPKRAAFGATVPVRVHFDSEQAASLYVKRVFLIVDNNPSPLTATIDVTPEVGRADFETRIRIDEYSHVRVIAEMSDGQLHMDVDYVKTSGGCSAPPNRERPEEIGRILLRLVEPDKTPIAGTPVRFDFQVRHPNDTGFELDHRTVMYIPPHFVRDVEITYGGRPLWHADLDFSVSENPYFRLNVVPRGHEALRADVEDSRGQRYSATLPILVGD